MLIRFASQSGDDVGLDEAGAVTRPRQSGRPHAVGLTQVVQVDQRDLCNADFSSCTSEEFIIDLPDVELRPLTFS